MNQDGFQPCVLETSTDPPTPRWERTIVVFSLAVHILDHVFDVLVLRHFYLQQQWSFFIGTAMVILLSLVIASVYVGMGTGSPTGGDIDDDPGDRRSAFAKGHVHRCLTDFAIVRVFVEANNCLCLGGDADYFHTLRLMESVLQSAPNAAMQLYALALWAVQHDNKFAETSELDVHGARLLKASVLVSLVSVGLGLAMWEQKVQFQASRWYIGAIGLFRFLELASRCLSVAVFAAITHPNGFALVLSVDYLVMLFLIMRHRSVQLAYGLVVALPLVLISLEPMVWRRGDHAVPKDNYFKVRLAQFVIMWFWVVQTPIAGGGGVVADSVWFSCRASALLSTIGLYIVLPCVWVKAQKLLLARDASEWADEDGVEEQLQDGRALSDYGESGSDGEHGDDAENRSMMPGE
eukprot:TRINITY_DN40041_c0_g1_i1.p1 TRINITY_DN40041_c0_g1~~TRINITY_DN40041_c0_g1_i1.p1  ORF type:complete len:407 (-),score=61.82 TRINITY_DN40041_c0_g1_i1:109-1329(-)